MALESDFRIRDPFVLVDGGKYWLYESKPWSGGNGVAFRTSADLVSWTAKKPAMVYCHEWCQMGNGTIEYAPLSPDFASFEASPVSLLDARSAMEGAGSITDGPFFHRSAKSGRLYMIWSNTVKGRGYCVFVRSSESGKIAGPWTKDELLFGANGGHAMIFTDLKGRLRMTLHRPNKSPDERMKLFWLEDDGEKLRIAEK